ncbi:MAG: hypothetical protein A2138_16390 [Deltaproteobacteria bacterium RBG_16_71_12]|nr:MAG: hypothetical protein A2138_16390 [Deltaproteobacteria bacterium RBG_16_71_12]
MPRSSSFAPFALAVALIVPTGCKKAIESAEGAAIAAASGGKAKLTADGNIEVKTDEGTAKIELSGDKGVATITGQNADGTKFNAAFGADAKVPDGFPLPVMDGIKVMQGVVGDKNGKKSYAIMGTIAKPAKEVADFYDAAMKKAGLTVTRSEANLGGMVMLSLSGEGGGHKMGLVVQEAKGQTNVTFGGEW